MTEKSHNEESCKSYAKVRFRALLWYGLSLALLGFCAGAFSGLSRNPVVNVLLPLLFGLIGGASGLYLARINYESPDDLRKISVMGRMLSVFLLFLLAGAFYGILIRTGTPFYLFVPHDSQKISLKFQIPDNLTAKDEVELILLRYRLNMIGADIEEQNSVLTKVGQVLLNKDRAFLLALEEIIEKIKTNYNLLAKLPPIKNDDERNRIITKYKKNLIDVLSELKNFFEWGKINYQKDPSVIKTIIDNRGIVSQYSGLIYLPYGSMTKDYLEINHICRLWLEKNNLFQNLSDLSRKLNDVFDNYKQDPLNRNLLEYIDKLIVTNTHNPEDEIEVRPTMAKPPEASNK